ncbi:MAG: GIY-YIG nuclease family protein [Cyclobacteriaceae bacterium]|nr:GIY-YIG nuclease family protein [Cyclobacteriaceae bacterium]
MGSFVYILQSQLNHSFYKGSTNDLVARFKRHKARLDPACPAFLF